MPFGSITKERQAFSARRLNELVSCLDSSEKLRQFPDICIYATGSFARGEAHARSDLDIFFLHKGSEKENAFTAIEEVTFYSEIIHECRELGFPEFSDGGKYLTTLYVDDGMGHLGGPTDDYKNYFTARTLLLLERKLILNTKIFEHVLSKTLQAYYRDYDPEVKDFRPVFLLNDLLRYWKTLCLNYEHRRNESRMNQNNIAETRIQNLKLKFSRILTCFSMILAVSQVGTGITAEQVAKISRKTPLERMYKISEISMLIDDQFRAVVKLYDWFLQVTGQPKDDLKTWIMDGENVKLYKRKADDFGDNFYDIIGKIILDDRLRRYLIL